MSLARGEKNVDYLRKRFEKMQAHHFFQDMEFTDDPTTVTAWTQLLTQGRDPEEPIAATRVLGGTDINFVSLTHQLVDYLEAQDNIKLATNHFVKDLKRKDDGGFLVSGQFLVCNNPDLVSKHEAKVYGKAAVGAPPMSVPHLDTRVIDGKKSLLFGPFAGFSPKFLKSGSLFDLVSSVNFPTSFPCWLWVRTTWISLNTSSSNVLSPMKIVSTH